MPNSIVKLFIIMIWFYCKLLSRLEHKTKVQNYCFFLVYDYAFLNIWDYLFVYKKICRCLKSPWFWTIIKLQSERLANQSHWFSQKGNDSVEAPRRE